MLCAECTFSSAAGWQEFICPHRQLATLASISHRAKMKRIPSVNTIGRYAGRILASALAVGLVLFVIEVRLRAGTAGGKAEVMGPAHSLVENVSPPSGPAELNFGGLKMVLEHEIEHERGIERVVNDISNTAKRRGWSEVDMEEGLDEILPLGNPRGDMQFRVFETDDKKMEVYIFESLDVGKGTRLSHSTVDITEVLDVLSGGGTTEAVEALKNVDLKEHYRYTVAGTPTMKYKRPGGSRIVLSELEGYGPAAAGEVEARLADAGWDLNPWALEVMDEFESEMKAQSGGEKDFWVARRGDEMCHAVLASLEDRMVVTYRFSSLREAKVENWDRTD